MTNVKPTIAILCDFIKLTSDFEIEPIFFKLAKYDKQDDIVVDKFWNLLNSLCQNNIGENIVDNIKIHFAGLNYKNLEFYSLPNDMEYGSRELLIAFSWLINKNDIFERLIKEKILESKFSYEFDVPEQPFKSEESIEVNCKTILDYQNYIFSLCGKINVNLKAISEYNEKTMKLLEKIHNATSELTVAELYHLKSEGNFNSYLKETKTVSNLLDTYWKWKTNEKHYWKWMLTVIELKEERNSIKLEKDNLVSFFKCLRGHVKQLLKNDEEKQKISMAIIDPRLRRCVKSDETKNDNSSMETKLSQLKSEEKNNLHEILKYLRNLF